MSTETLERVSRVHRRLDALISPDPAHDEALEELRRAINRAGGEGARLLVGDQALVMPTYLLKAIGQLVSHLANGSAVVLAPHGRKLTAPQAADLLGMSRTHLVSLLEEDKLPIHYERTEGNHRRLDFNDVLELRRQWSKESDEAALELLKRSHQFEKRQGNRSVGGQGSTTGF